jgi:hypothetical protein
MNLKINDKYSLILCIEAIGYFENWSEFLVKINSLLKEEGVFIFSYSNPDTWRYYLRKLRHLGKRTQNYNEMNFGKFKQLLKNCGFKIVEMEGMNWIPFPLSSNSLFVDLFISLERNLRLYRWLNQSPWLLFSVQKSVE